MMFRRSDQAERMKKTGTGARKHGASKGTAGAESRSAAQVAEMGKKRWGENGREEGRAAQIRWSGPLRASEGRKGRWGQKGGESLSIKGEPAVLKFQ